MQSTPALTHLPVQTPQTASASTSHFGQPPQAVPHENVSASGSDAVQTTKRRNTSAGADTFESERAIRPRLQTSHSVEMQRTHRFSDEELKTAKELSERNWIIKLDNNNMVLFSPAVIPDQTSPMAIEVFRAQVFTDDRHLRFLSTHNIEAGVFGNTLEVSSVIEFERLMATTSFPIHYTTASAAPQVRQPSAQGSSLEAAQVVQTSASDALAGRSSPLNPRPTSTLPGLKLPEHQSFEVVTRKMFEAKKRAQRQRDERIEVLDEMAETLRTLLGRVERERSNLSAKVER